MTAVAARANRPLSPILTDRELMAKVSVGSVKGRMRLRPQKLRAELDTQNKLARLS